MSGLARLRALERLAAAPRGRVAAAVLLAATATLAGVGLIATSGYLISKAALHPDVLSLEVTIVAVRFFGLLRPAARYLERLASHDVALRGLSSVRVSLYRRLIPLAPAGLAAYRRGDLLRRLVADVDELQNLYLRGLLPPLAAVVACVAAIAAEALLLPAAGLALAVGLIAAGVAVPALALADARRRATGAATARAALTATLLESLDGAEELVAFGAVEDRIAIAAAADRALVAAGRRDALGAGAADAAQIAIAGGTLVAVLLLAASAHHDGSLSGVLIAAVALLAFASFDAVQPLAETARSLARTSAAGGRLLAATASSPPVVEPLSPLPAPTTAAIGLLDASARYPGGAEVLRGVDLELRAGRRIALVGASGAGKSTLVALLERFLEPSSGALLVAGAPAGSYRADDVRALLAPAGQDAHAFSATIAENLRIARPDADAAALTAVLARAGLADFLRELPDGLETLVGVDGRALSGGQRQRLVLARALLRDAPLLVLDEPTAHLDPATAAAVVRDALAGAEGRGVLLISHRPEGIELMDEVLVLEDGRVIERGSPSALRAAGGRFAALVAPA